jgi:hypothetical protein
MVGRGFSPAVKVSQTMTEDELRTLVREAIARHLSDSGPQPGLSSVPVRLHPSHAKLGVRPGSDIEGPCLIEPTVRCNHCGYCQSLGH